MALREAPTEPLNDAFFEALERVQEIHSKVKILLRSNQQTAGLEIMEEMALHQEAGYERLYRWGQSQTRSLTQDEVEVGSVLQRAMQARVQKCPPARPGQYLNSKTNKIRTLSESAF